MTNNDERHFISHNQKVIFVIYQVLMTENELEMCMFT